MRTAFTLVELMIMLAVLGILATIGVPRLGALRDSAAVHGAATELMTELAVARQTAIARGVRVAVLLRPPPGTVTVAADADTILIRSLHADHGVTLTATRDSIAYGPIGLGYGAANMSAIVRRGRAADTVVVSRLGRVRR